MTSIEQTSALQVDIPYTKEEIETIPLLVKYIHYQFPKSWSVAEYQSFNEILDDKIKWVMDNLEGNWGVYGEEDYMRYEHKIIALWKGEPIPTEREPRLPNTDTYRAHLNFAPNQIEALTQFAIVRRMTLGELIADESRASLRGSIDELRHRKEVPADVTEKLVKVWKVP